MASKKNQGKKQPNPPQAKIKPQEKRGPSGKNLSKSGSAQWYVIPALIFVLCFTLYGNSIQHGYVLDDDIYTRKNVYVQEGFSHLKDIFNKGSLYGFNKVGESQYRPLALLNFMIEVQWFGLNPHVSHFFNVLFFAIACILLFLLLKRIFYQYNPLIPLSIILLYVFHPIHTEVVANIKSRDEILGFMFGVLSLLLLMRYKEEGKSKLYTWSLIAFACAGFSKENYLMFAIVAPLVIYYFTDTDIKKSLYQSIPFIGIVVFYILVRGAVLTNNTFKDKLEIINNSLMAAKSGSDQLATEFVMLGKYLYLLVIPYPLSWDYSYNQIPIVSFANIKAIGSVLLYLALGGYAVWSFKNKSLYSFAIFFYLLTMFLTSNLMVKIGSSFGERFLFAPSLSFCMVVPFFMAKALKLNPEDMKWHNKNTFYTILGVILLVYACILIPRNGDWEDSLPLFKSGVIASPNSVRAHDALAREYRSQAEATNDPAQKHQLYAMSLAEFHKALNIYDKDADLYYNMGVSYYEDGMQDSAMYVYLKAVAVNPKYTLAYNNLGVISFNKKDFPKAIEYFENSYKADTNNAQALANIGAAYQNEGNNDKAVYYYNMVLQKDPNNATVRNNLSKIKR